MTALVAHKYMPEQMPDAELRATFTAREHTLDFLVKALRDQIGSRTLTSYLITGPRGSGKTTLVLMLCLRIHEDSELEAGWLPVRFPEELPAITSLRDLFAAALAVMAEDGIDGARAWHEKVEREPDERRSRDLAVTALRRIAEERGKRLILFVENFDQLFERVGTKEEATLRRLLMADPFMLIVGTTVRQFEALRDYGRAFFNYFCDVPLKRLDDEQVKALLVSRAEWDERPDVAERCGAQQADIRAICRLTGGNARLAVMLYEILSHGDIKSVVATLWQLVDQLTPLIKDVLEHQLTDQQRKVVDALMRAGGTATPRALAGATRLSLNTVTTQLQRLKEAEIVDVQGGGKGRPAYYFVPDQLFCTWYQMRYLHPLRRRIEMFLEVLRTWFKAEERLDMAKSIVATASSYRGGPLVSAAVAAEYYAASLAGTEHGGAALDLAVTTWLRTEDLQQAALALAELRNVHGDDRRLGEAIAYASLGEWAEQHGDIATAVQALQIAVDCNPTDTETRLRYGVALGKQGSHGRALGCFDEVARIETDPRVKSSALVNRGVTRGAQGDTSGAIADYTATVELEGAPDEEVARAYLGRGVARGLQGDTSGAIGDLTAVVELKGALRQEVARALFNCGLARRRQGDISGAIADYTRAVELEGAPREEVARALINRGVARGQQGDTSGAIADCTAAIELEGAPSEHVAMALVNRAVDRQQQGDISGAIADYTAVVELDGVPREVVAAALVGRGFTQGQQGNTSGAIADYTVVVELEGAPHEEVARALINRGFTRGRQGDTSGEIADYTTVVDLEGALREQVAKALVNRGVARSEQGDASGAVCDLTAGLDLAEVAPEVQAVALINRAEAYVSLSQLDRAFEDAITVAGNAVYASPLRITAFLTAARVSSSDQRRMERICSDAKAFVTSFASEERRQCIIELLSGLSSPETASVWLRLWRAVGRDQPQDVLSSLAFLDAVADVLEGRERSVLNPLPPEQREFAEDILRKLVAPTDTGSS